MTNKILNILGIIILAFVPQFLIDAYKDIQAEWTKPVAKPVAKKKARAKKSAPKKAAPKKQVENKAPAKKRVHKSKEQPIVAPTAQETK